MWFSESVLALPKASEKSFVGGQSGVEVGSVFCELPALSFELEVVGNERPVEGRHPVSDVVVLLDPGLVMCVMGGKLNGGVVVDVVV